MRKGGKIGETKIRPATISRNVLHETTCQTLNVNLPSVCKVLAFSDLIIFQTLENVVVFCIENERII